MWKEQKLQIKARTRMPSQHSIPIQSQAESKQLEGIVVPLDLPDLKIVKQEVQTDGSIEVHVRALTDREACPRCRNICVKVHDIPFSFHSGIMDLSTDVPLFGGCFSICDRSTIHLTTPYFVLFVPNILTFF